MENNDVLSIQQSLQIVGRSPLLIDALRSAIQVAPYDVNVLVCGENGVGKEVFHKIIHNYSPRRYKKCVAVNCGGLPEGTIDSELFGHVKGAYTGAVSDRKGYFEEADGGTIFLDEIGELPLATQARLLRVIETGEYYRMGSGEVRKTDVRIVAATNVDLMKAINKGKFREDLYYRLSTIKINVPALRDRQEDIHLLFRKFASDIANKYKMPPIQLDDNARRLLLAYQWPGNVRQLLHVVEHISIVENSRLISVETLQKYLPVFSSGVSVHDESNATGSTFAPGEKEMLYKLIYTMKNQLEEVRKQLGLYTAPSESHVPQALPAAPIVSDFSVSTQYPTPSFTRPVNDVIDAEIEEVGNDYMPAHAVEPQEQPKTIAELEKAAIKQALDRNRGNKRKAADELGISERTIHRKIQDYNL